MDNIEIGKRIRQARTMRQYTLEDVAQKIGVAKSTIQRYENGKIEKIKIPVIDSIANALSVNPAWLVGKSTEIVSHAKTTPRIMKYYEKLNDLGKQEATKRVEELTYLPQYTNSPLVNAAHAYENANDEDKVHDEDIMNNNNLWDSI